MCARNRGGYFSPREAKESLPVRETGARANYISSLELAKASLGGSRDISALKRAREAAGNNASSRLMPAAGAAGAAAGWSSVRLSGERHRAVLGGLRAKLRGKTAAPVKKEPPWSF